MRKIILVLLPIVVLSSCSDTPKSDQKEVKTELKAKINTENEEKSLNDSDTIPFRIITTGIFHNDEVSSDVSSLKWIGLFKGPNGYYLKQTKIRAAQVNDPVLDEENQKSAWELTVPNKDTNLILIAPTSRFKEQKVRKAVISKQSIYPDEAVSFRYLGIDYKLYATGNKEKESEDSDWYIVSNYKLYVTATINGKHCKSLLSEHDNFDDNMVVLVFAGDLDNDGIADFILNNSHHYNAVVPTIYLSKQAAIGQVVKQSASHTSVGC